MISNINLSLKTQRETKAANSIMASKDVSASLLIHVQNFVEAPGFSMKTKYFLNVAALPNFRTYENEFSLYLVAVLIRISLAESHLKFPLEHLIT